MKFCQKCGKELIDEAVVCPGCGCAIAEGGSKQKTASYEDAVKGAQITNIISIVLLVVAVFCWLWVNMLLGSFLCLAAEIVALIPNSKLNSAFKQNGMTKGDKKEMKEKRKAITRDLKSRFTGYKLSKILAIVSLILLIVSFI